MCAEVWTTVTTVLACFFACVNRLDMGVDVWCRYVRNEAALMRRSYTPWA